MKIISDLSNIMQRSSEQLSDTELCQTISSLNIYLKNGGTYSKFLNKLSFQPTKRSRMLISLIQMLSKFPQIWVDLFLNQQIHCPTKSVNLQQFMYIFYNKILTLTFGLISTKILFQRAKNEIQQHICIITSKFTAVYLSCKQSLFLNVDNLNTWAQTIKYSNKYIMFKVIKQLSTECNFAVKEIIIPLFDSKDEVKLNLFSKWVIEKHELINIHFSSTIQDWIIEKRSQTEVQFQQKLTNYLKSLKNKQDNLIFTEALRNDGKKGLLITEHSKTGLDQKYLIFSDDNGAFTIMNAVFVTHRWKANNFTTQFGNINIHNQTKIENLIIKKEEVISQMRTAPTSVTNLHMQGIQNVGDSLGKCLANFENYDSIDSFIKDFSKKTAIAGSISYLVLKIPALGGLMIVGGFSYSLYNILTCDYKNNKHKLKQFGKLSIKTSTSIGGGLLGAAIGQAILPIPFVGMFVGGVIGGYLSTIGSNKVFEFLKNKNQQKMYLQLKKQIQPNGSWKYHKKMLQLFGFKSQYFQKSIPKNLLSQNDYKDLWMTTFCFCILSYFQSKKDELQMKKQLQGASDDDILIQKLVKIKQSGEKTEFVCSQLQKCIFYLQNHNILLRQNLKQIIEIMGKILQW